MSSDLTNVLELYCYLLDETEKNCFDVIVNKTDKVSSLRRKIWERREAIFKERRIDFDKLDLWQVSLPDGDNLWSRALKLLKDKKSWKEPLRSSFLLSKYWRDTPEPESVHVLVKAAEWPVPHSPEDDEVNNLLKAFNTTLQHGISGPAPSTLTRIHFLAKKKYKFNEDYLVGRPIENFGLPIGLYHPVFNMFQRNLVNENIDDFPSEFLAEIQKLFVVASDFYAYEMDRSTELRPVLNSLLDTVIERSQNADKTSSDGAVDVKIKSDVLGISLIEEEKNEIGLGECDPSLQAGRSYLRRWSQDLYRRTRNACCCPTFLMAIAGPWMCVLGAVLTDKVIVQPLTDYVWLGGNHYDIENYRVIGRLFRSLSMGLKELDEFYRGLPQADTLLQERMFPYIRSFSREGKEMNFSYLSPLSGRKPVFLAQLDDKTKVVVKFVQCYNSIGHDLLAEVHLAPRLLYCGLDDTSAPFFGRLRMIVMEYIDAVTAHEAMQEKKLGRGVYESVERAVNALHQRDLVFGDLRPANIMIKSQDAAILVDFDWCSIEGQGRYPPNLNMSAAVWHSEVKGNGVMMKAHDLSLLAAFEAKCF